MQIGRITGAAREAVSVGAERSPSQDAPSVTGRSNGSPPFRAPAPPCPGDLEKFPPLTGNIPWRSSPCLSLEPPPVCASSPISHPSHRSPPPGARLASGLLHATAKDLGFGLAQVGSCDEAIEEFFGQLWVIPSSPPRPPPSSRANQPLI
jgi:hypothetical protein